jgi:hypothetical protein
MKQPLYKFGDRLTDTRDELVITVHEIILMGNTYIYADGARTIPEKCAELYQEPQKKKLYAFRFIKDSEKEIIFSQLTELQNKHMERAYEYDIEYPRHDEEGL